LGLEPGCPPGDQVFWAFSRQESRELIAGGKLRGRSVVDTDQTSSAKVFAFETAFGHGDFSPLDYLVQPGIFRPGAK
jgi:hypothetical protein